VHHQAEKPGYPVHPARLQHQVQPAPTLLGTRLGQRRWKRRHGSSLCQNISIRHLHAIRIHLKGGKQRPPHHQFRTRQDSPAGAAILPNGPLGRLSRLSRHPPPGGRPPNLPIDISSLARRKPRSRAYDRPHRSPKCRAKTLPIQRFSPRPPPLYVTARPGKGGRFHLHFFMAQRCRMCCGSVGRAAVRCWGIRMCLG
jgi:hypothetical protein